MATERQIEANRRNAGRSTGPKTEEGKARSRANATKHGMAGELADLEADFSPEFLERRAKWSVGRELPDEAAGWALDRAVAASLRVERCERSLEQVVTLETRRAELCWDQDRALEAEQVAVSIADRPGLTSRKLQTSRAGVEWLLEAWQGLLDILDDGQTWSDAHRSRAYDLLGLAPDRRVESVQTAGTDRTELAEIQRSMATGELERLESLRDEAFVEIDEAERAIAMAGGRALLSKPARLILRYERDAWRRYRESMKQLESPGSNPPADQAGPPASIPTPAQNPPRPSIRVEARSKPLVEPPREEGLGAVERLAALGLELPEWVATIPEGDEDAWYEEFERRAEALGLNGAFA